MTSNPSVEFFDTQFQRQVQAQEFVLNPFEEAALPYLAGRVLDLGCGLGNLTVAAARRGCDVVAVDASQTAMEHLSRVARSEGLRVTPVLAEIERFEFRESFDVVAAIGLLMFFERPVASELMQRLQHAVRPGGRAIVNVLIQGTTFLGMFDADRYCLFARDELEAWFATWDIELARQDEFPAPGGTVKRFSTVVARKPSSSGG